MLTLCLLLAACADTDLKRLDAEVVRETLRHTSALHGMLTEDRESSSDSGPVIALLAGAAFVVPIVLFIGGSKLANSQSFHPDLLTFAFFIVSEGVGIALITRAFWSFGKWIALGLALLIYAPFMYYALVMLALLAAGGI